MTGITFQEALAQTATVRPSCSVVRALRLLSDENRASAEAALANEKISVRNLRKAFALLLGPESPKASAIGDHRAGRHQACPRLTTP